MTRPLPRRTPSRRARPGAAALRAGLAAGVACVLLAGCSASGTDQPTGDGAGAAAPARDSDDPTQDASPSGAEVERYVALGDSYAAAPLVPTTDVADGCFRSDANYASLVAEALGAQVDDRSCGSASTRDLTRSQLPNVPPQLDALGPDTDLVTIGIGGNDGNVFAQLVGRCPQVARQDPQGSPCSDLMKSDGGDRLLDGLRAARGDVVAAVRAVVEKAPDARVLVVGYPQIVDADRTCAELPLAAGDYAYAEEVNRALNTNLVRAAKVTGATYVDVWAASAGHDVCSEDPWVNGATNDERRAARYHPFAVEQQAVADLVLDLVRG